MPLPAPTGIAEAACGAASAIAAPAKAIKKNLRMFSLLPGPPRRAIEEAPEALNLA